MSDQDEVEFFSEAEVYKALRWGMSDSEAARLAKLMSDDPAVEATHPWLRDLGPICGIYTEDMLMLLSLVSEETHRKAERRLLQQRLVKELSPDERVKWEKRRSEFRTALIKAGEIPPE